MTLICRLSPLLAAAGTQSISLWLRQHCVAFDATVSFGYPARVAEFFLCGRPMGDEVNC